MERAKRCKVSKSEEMHEKRSKRREGASDEMSSAVKSSNDFM